MSYHHEFHSAEDEFLEDVDNQEQLDGSGDGADDDVALDEYEMLTKVTDTSAAQARKGKDIQGIPWEMLNITRESYRLTRLEQYRNFENILTSGETADKDCKEVEKGDRYYEFFYNTRVVKPTILHFQLRNLVWATSKHDVYLVSNYSIMHWSSLSGNLSEIINFSGHIAPTERCAGNQLEGFSQTQISTLAVKDNFLVAGGFQGELTCKRLDKEGVSFCTRTTHDDNAITNAVEIYESLSGATHFIAANNDSGVREYDIEKFQLLNHLQFPWPVNHTSISPDCKLMTVVGDNLDGLLVDPQNGKTIATLTGHQDYSFASAWHPNGHTFAEMCETLKTNYQLSDEIGRGRFGTIYRCFHPSSAVPHACKVIDKSLLSDSTDRECLENEPKFLSLLSPHPNILQIFDVFENDEFLSIVLELCQPLTLLDRIVSNPVTEQQAASLIKKLLEAVVHCHRLGVAHRDIKPDNILFDSNDNLKLADFGSAEWFGDGRTMSGVVGTPYYVAPEVLLGRDYTEKVDVWSVGVILYIMLSGIPPFYGDSATEIFEAVIRANLRFPSRIFRSVSSSAKDLLRKMICRDASRRFSAEQALRHPWIVSGGETTNQN